MGMDMTIALPSASYRGGRSCIRHSSISDADWSRQVQVWVEWVDRSPFREGAVGN